MALLTTLCPELLNSPSDLSHWGNCRVRGRIAVVHYEKRKIRTMKLSTIVVVLLLLVSLTGIEARFPPSYDRQLLNKFKRLYPQALKKIHNDVKHGAKVALASCKNEFKNSLWNCDLNVTKVLRKEVPVFALNSLPATREGAYLQALGSASAMHTLVRNCRKGMYESCSCVPVDSDGDASKNWRWQGCNANLRFGEAMTKHFIDRLEERSTDRERAALNHHNNRAGRRVVKNIARRRCKCVGATNSCHYVVCWKQLLNFTFVEEGVKKLYSESSLRVNSTKNCRIEPYSNTTDLERVTDDHLAFFEESPDHCKPDDRTGFPGMLGRKCSKERCKQMCESCGKKVKHVREVEVEVSSRRNCTFVWCCSVKCSPFIERVKVGTCM